MPQFTHRLFGAVECPDEAIIEFPRGLPGFPGETRFALIEPPAHPPLVLLQSLATPELCFVTLPVELIDRGYDLKVLPEDLRAIGWTADQPPAVGKDVLCLGLVCLRDDAPPTVNLLGPIVVHRAARTAVQAVRDDRRYPANRELAC